MVLRCVLALATSARVAAAEPSISIPMVVGLSVDRDSSGFAGGFHLEITYGDRELDADTWAFGGYGELLRNHDDVAVVGGGATAIHYEGPLVVAGSLGLHRELGDETGAVVSAFVGIRNWYRPALFDQLFGLHLDVRTGFVSREPTLMVGARIDPVGLGVVVYDVFATIGAMLH